jgi:hypothetical protein
LLERANTTTTDPTSEKKDWANDYLSSFKVAQYTTKVADEKEEEEEAEKPEILKEEAPQTDPDYWEKLLRHHYEHEQELEQQQLGKGKRIRRQVNYAANDQLQQDWNAKNRKENDEDYSMSEIETDEESDDMTGDDELTSEQRAAKKQRQRGKTSLRLS